ncbi:hypothetical protein HDV05_001535 [Chytridiales sp. JEL 0842]|nr:hypothetical protein HDV05_001535 [Chytridiales sp. JEL 0842]
MMWETSSISEQTATAPVSSHGGTDTPSDDSQPVLQVPDNISVHQIPVASIPNSTTLVMPAQIRPHPRAVMNDVSYMQGPFAAPYANSSSSVSYHPPTWPAPPLQMPYQPPSGLPQDPHVFSPPPEPPSLQATLLYPPETPYPLQTIPPVGERPLKEVEAQSRQIVTARALDVSGLRHRSGVARQLLNQDIGARGSPRHPIMRKAGQPIPIARTGATTYRRIGTPGNPNTTINSYNTRPADEEWDWWTFASKAMTFYVCSCCLARCGKDDVLMQQAWREKVSLCIIILAVMACFMYMTFGMKATFCPNDTISNIADAALNQTDHFTIPYRDDLIIYGYIYDFVQVAEILAVRGGIALTSDWYGSDITKLFPPQIDRCATFTTTLNLEACSIPNKFPRSPPLAPRPGQPCPELSWLQGLSPKGRLYFTWDDIRSNLGPPHSLLVFNGVVLNLTALIQQPAENRITNGVTRVETIISQNIGSDATISLSANYASFSMAKCLEQKYIAGFIGDIPIGCVSTRAIQWIVLSVIFSVVIARFFMAIAFAWFFSEKLVRDRKHKYDAKKMNKMIRAVPLRDFDTVDDENKKVKAVDTITDHERRPLYKDDPYVILLVTCYSESEDSIRKTIDSLARTDYPDSRKLLFVIADGQITGHGNAKSTPDSVVGMIAQHPEMLTPEPKSYLAIADGFRQHNMAKVHAGLYHHTHGGSVPIVAVSKCGSPEEQTSFNQKKAGNRGKRDSQMILMNFLSRILFSDDMTPLDHDLAWKIHTVTGGVYPDAYQLVLMVDADTIVATESLHYMVQAMKNDDSIIGLCGETRITNKTASWVTAIQVFEYYISHHLGKAFESLFGGVSCLPGCFCMYRIKAPKGPGGTWMVPILANPDIVEEYSENVVDTLHKKNLLLLGEDRFLTTLMLRTFPKRKLIFVPQAIELIGTVVLPAALVSLLIIPIMSMTSEHTDTLPLIMMGAILALPPVLIILTTRKVVYILWMFVYLLALPVWNFILPLYAFWNFDDFSWGKTRTIEGEFSQSGSGPQDDHSRRDGEYMPGSVALRPWVEWEVERLNTLRLQKMTSAATLSNDSTSSGSTWNSVTVSRKTRALPDMPTVTPLTAVETLLRKVSMKEERRPSYVDVQDQQQISAGSSLLKTLVTSLIWARRGITGSVPAAEPLKFANAPGMMEDQGAISLQKTVVVVDQDISNNASTPNAVANNGASTSITVASDTLSTIGEVAGKIGSALYINAHVIKESSRSKIASSVICVTSIQRERPSGSSTYIKHNQKLGRLFRQQYFGTAAYNTYRQLGRFEDLP